MTPAAVVVAVLVASVVVASLLAFQAIAAARSREAVSNAMLRQYAELAAWEFSREARQQIDSALNHMLARDAHPEGTGKCDCAHVEPVEHAFQFTDRGVQGRPGALPDELIAAIAAHLQGAPTGSMDGGVQLRPIAGGRFIAFRWEPHVGDAGGQIGLVAPLSALTSTLQRSYQRTQLLPSVMNPDDKRAIDVAIAGPGDRVVFQSRGRQRDPRPIGPICWRIGRCRCSCAPR